VEKNGYGKPGKVAIIWDEKCDTYGIIMGNMDLAIKEIAISPSGVVISP
jgi:hypothetical protein